VAQDPGKAVDGGNGNEKERGAKDHICTSFARRRARRARRREFCDVEKNCVVSALGVSFIFNNTLSIPSFFFALPSHRRL